MFYKHFSEVSYAVNSIVVSSGSCLRCHLFSLGWLRTQNYDLQRIPTSPSQYVVTSFIRCISTIFSSQSTGVIGYFRYSCLLESATGCCLSPGPALPETYVTSRLMGNVSCPICLHPFTLTHSHLKTPISWHAPSQTSHYAHCQPLVQWQRLYHLQRTALLSSAVVSLAARLLTISLHTLRIPLALPRSH